MSQKKKLFFDSSDSKETRSKHSCSAIRTGALSQEDIDSEECKKKRRKRTRKHCVSSVSDSSDSKVHSLDKDETRSQSAFTKVHVKRSRVIQNTEYTPLEQQYLDIKKNYPDTILLIECGYRYRSFDNDAEIVSKELNLGCFPDHNFVSSSFPVHRLGVHLRRLVAKGHKVGLVKQVETSALKAAGDNRNRIFERKLSAIYTKSTLIDEFPICDGGNVDEGATDTAGYLVCIYETPKKTKNEVEIGMVAVRPTTGDIGYWCLVDGLQRGKLESALIQLQPVEIVVPLLALSSATEQLLNYILKSLCTVDEEIHLERIDDSKFLLADALIKISEYYELKDNSNSEVDVKASLHSLPPIIICCMGALFEYLQQFHLQDVLNPCYIKEMFGSPDIMFLTASTIKSLELFHNKSYGSVTENGTLLQVLDNTNTRFGKRLLRQWIAQPLTNKRKIESRQQIVTEILTSTETIFSTLRKHLRKMPDLEKLLCASLHLRICCQDFYILLEHLHYTCELLKMFHSEISSNITSPKLKSALINITDLLKPVTLQNLNAAAFRAGDKTNLFKDVSHSLAFTKCQNDIGDVLSKIDALKPSIASIIGSQSFEFVTVGGQEFLIEVKNEQKKIPIEWIKISGTKQVSRYRSPEVERLFCQLCQLRETLQQCGHDLWIEYLRNFNGKFYSCKRAIHLLATLDCYFSLADFARQEGYCRPEIEKGDQNILLIRKGRHPVLEKFYTNRHQYVANDTELCGEKSCLIITGPNMGGKSSYVRQVALIVLLAHIGSYIPAESACISVTDGIFLRMGAMDDICRKQSTFLLEMQETSEILQVATEHSLVILDELGRGTSTNDGMAIAFATLHHFMTRVKSRTLFVTHYLPVLDLCQNHPSKVGSKHMSFLVSHEKEEDDSPETLTFLYQLMDGAAERSYGMNVARLAGIPQGVVSGASQKSQTLENHVVTRRKILEDFTSVFQSSTRTVFSNLSKLH